jgi:hypothetical protein
MLFWITIGGGSRWVMTNPAQANPTTAPLVISLYNLFPPFREAPSLTHATDLHALRLSAGCLFEQPHANPLSDSFIAADLSGTQMGCRSSQAQDLGDISLHSSPPLLKAPDAIAGHNGLLL